MPSICVHDWRAVAHQPGIPLQPRIPAGHRCLIEHPFAHGTYRFLAQQLSGANLDVLSFDYFGTGDSAGEFEQANADQWMSDIGTAITELKDAAQAYGTRFLRAAAIDAVKRGDTTLSEINRVTFVD